MQKSKIEWTDYTWNPVKGLCPGVYAECAEFCYARKIYKRFKLDPTIRLDMKELDSHPPRKPARIFVGSTFDYSFARPNWIEAIIDRVELYPQHTFIFLTKNPSWYSQYIWPENCWLGMTVYGSSAILPDDKFDWRERDRFREFKNLQVPNLKFVSFEPLLRDALGDEDLKGIDWVIVGSLTRPNIQPEWGWVKNIISKSKDARCKIFMKNNLEIPDNDCKTMSRAVWDYRIQQIPESK